MESNHRLSQCSMPVAPFAGVSLPTVVVRTVKSLIILFFLVSTIVILMSFLQHFYQRKFVMSLTLPPRMQFHHRASYLIPRGSLPAILADGKETFAAMFVRTLCYVNEVMLATRPRQMANEAMTFIMVLHPQQCCHERQSFQSFKNILHIPAIPINPCLYSTLVSTIRANSLPGSLYAVELDGMAAGAGLLPSGHFI